MMVSNPKSRAGITLTEILISLLIMTIGLISLATLFPLSLSRVRDANRNSRSTLLGKSGVSDLGVRNLLDKRSFFISWYNPNNPGYFPFYFDPFTQDPNWQDNMTPTVTGVNSTFGAGLPICYDPLWRAHAEPNPALGMTNGVGVYPNPSIEARFANGIGYLRNDPGDGGLPSAFGLQRITNFFPWSPAVASWPFVYAPKGYPNAPDVAGAVFASLDDIVWQTDGIKSTAFNPYATGVGNPTVPDLSGGGLLNDWKYTWFFTGYQVDATDPSPDVFTGNIVVCESRPFAFDVMPSPLGTGPMTVASGETVVEAIFGYGNFSQSVSGTGLYYAVGGDNVVLLRWPAAMTDPQVRSGGFIADVTYERYSGNLPTRFAGSRYPAQRCYWYRVVRKSAAAADPVVPGYRFMTVVLDSPVQAKTAFNSNTGAMQINAALIMPSVVNVFPKLIYVR